MDPLKPAEEITLRRVALAIGGERLPGADIRRLKRLNLIELACASWRLTPLGRQRYASLPKPPLSLGKAARVANEIHRILEKHAGRREG